MAHLSIGAFGPVRVTLDGQAITDRAYDKVWALLVYLAHSAERPHQRETLAGLLWPDQPEAMARTNLRQALTRLRQAIGDSGATPPFLSIGRTRLQFNPASDSEMDSTAFAALLDGCATHAPHPAETCSACADRRTRALTLYRGEFLETFSVGDSDLFEAWMTVERGRLHRHALAALSDLVAYHEQRGDYEQALRFGERHLELEPWSEEAYRQTMRLLARSGRRSEALLRYQRCRAILDSELGVAPSDETAALVEQIQADAFATPATAKYPAPLRADCPDTLPLDPIPFIGRDQELATLAKLLANRQCRLLTLLGPGGVGKTRLALQAAREAHTVFADGATFVALAPLSAAATIVSTVAAALGFTPDDHAAQQAQLLAYLRRREILLILDNIEHLLVPR